MVYAYLPDPVRYRLHSSIYCGGMYETKYLVPLLARDSTLSSHNKLILYKLMLRPILTYAASVWSNTSTTNYRHLQTLQSKCLRVTGNYPRRTPIHLLHSTLSIEPLHQFIYRLSGKFFHQCSIHQNPLVQQI
jgi:hypothetical protein